ncbi:MAG: nucleotidyltransferase family protein [Aquabacterium sp.]
MSIAGLILAAGQATRFGSDKRQALLPDGCSMLEAVIVRYREVFDTLLLVAQADDPFAQQLADIHGIELVVNEQADLGMGHSLACGAQALLAREGLSGVVVGLADMPAVAIATLLDVRETLMARGQPVVPSYQGRLGQPRGLPADWFEALSRLTGDQGARQLLDWRQAVALHVNDPGVLHDVDTPADLDRLGAMRRR